MSCTKCFFKKEFNNSVLQNLGCTISDIKNTGKNVKMSFHYNLLNRVNIEDLLDMVRQSNPLLKISYTKNTTGDLSQVKETEKPVWDFSIDGDGRHLNLKRV